MTEYLEPDHPAPEDRSARAASLRSRAAVHARDRDAWLALFRDDALVQDPVGRSPLDETGDGHRGLQAIGDFWDNVIAPNPVFAPILGLLTPITDGDRCFAEWSAEFSCDPKDEDDLVAGIGSNVFQGGFDALKRHFGG